MSDSFDTSVLRKMRPHKPTYENAVAFSELFEQAHHIIFRYIYSLRGGPVEVVEDLTADTFWRAWRGRKSFEGNQKAAISWLLKIARRLVIDEYRRSKSQGFSADLEEVILRDPKDTPEETVQLRDQMEILVELLKGLTLEQREVIMLRYTFGWRVKDIGEYLNKPENTISVIIRRTLEKLRHQWPEQQLPY